MIFFLKILTKQKKKIMTTTVHNNYMTIRGRPGTKHPWKTYDLYLFNPRGELEPTTLWSRNRMNADVLNAYHNKVATFFDDVHSTKIKKLFNCRKRSKKRRNIRCYTENICNDLIKTVEALILKDFTFFTIDEEYDDSDDDYDTFDSESDDYWDDSDDDSDQVRSDPEAFWPFSRNKCLKNFMIGKVSGPRTASFRTAVTGRFRKKYYKAGYTHICMLHIMDPVQLKLTGKQCEDIALNLESELRATFEHCEAFEGKLSTHGSGAVAKKNPNRSWYGVYMALKLFES